MTTTASVASSGRVDTAGCPSVLGGRVAIGGPVTIPMPFAWSIMEAMRAVFKDFSLGVGSLGSYTTDRDEQEVFILFN